MTYRLLRFILTLISRLPFRVLYALSDIIYILVYHVVRYRRRIVRRNLEESFPEKSHREIVEIERKFYHFFVDMVLESLKLMTISEEELMKRMKFTNIEIVNARIREGKTISAYLGHYGNWEWISSTALWMDRRVVAAQIYHELSNKSMDRLIREMRERMGQKCVEMHQTVRYVAAAAHDGRPHILGLLADQSPRWRESKHFIPFLNHNVPVLTGTEKFTKHFGFEAMFIHTRRVRRGYYECEFSVLHPDPKSLPDFELTKIYFDTLEREIREQPELYLWTHNRFRYAKANTQTDEQ